MKRISFIGWSVGISSVAALVCAVVDWAHGSVPARHASRVLLLVAVVAATCPFVLIAWAYLRIRRQRKD